MHRGRPVWAAAAALTVAAAWAATALAGEVAGTAGQDDLTIVSGGATQALVLVSPEAGKMEKLAATDLAEYVARMSGARPAVVNTAGGIDRALKSQAPLLIVGGLAPAVEPALASRLAAAAKKDPTLRADAIVLRRDGNRVYLAGNNDDSHYYAVSWLLRLWGCRWYMPTDFGECIPSRATLKVGQLDHACGSPFEVRRYWISWNGDSTGAAEFKRRNFFNEVHVPNGHHLAAYTKDLVPPGKGVLNVPIAEPSTARHVAGKVSAQFGRGQDVMLGMEDGIYVSDSPVDRQLKKLQFDKYFMQPAMTDAFMVFYNAVADILMKEHPASRAHIGFLAYSNMTLPPVRPVVAARPLVAYLAPIDFDPIHGMDDPQSPPRREYRDLLYKWAKVMRGRLVIYDYDQSMLVWRDMPNPSFQAFRHDVKHYLRAGILGVDVESRNAIATTFLNLHIRGQLMWDPDTDVDALLEEFYPRFYGPAAGPMKAYWTAVFDAWKHTIVTEHEHLLAPAIYTPQLIEALRGHLRRGEALIEPLAAKADPTRDERLHLDRMRFTRLSFDVTDHYLAMVRHAAREVDYAAAVAAGREGLAAREELTKANGTFTTYRRMPERGPAWWPGEVQQYAELLAFTDGTRGRLVRKLPVEWAFHRDPDRIGDRAGYAAGAVDLAYWKTHAGRYTPDSLKDYPVDQWEMLRTDLYAQAQGIRAPDRQSYLGYLWYRTDVDLPAEVAGEAIHIRLPGVLNESWLYVNGRQVGHRPQHKLWWMNDYRFEWDVDLTGTLRPGANTIALKLDDVHHWGGIFRRPFLYTPSKSGS